MRFLFLAFVILFSSRASAADNYALVKDVSGFTHLETSIVQDISVSYRGTSESESETILYHVNRAYGLLDDFYENASSCRNRSLNIYHVEGSTIDNRSVMHFVNWDAIGNRSLYWYYDARASPRGTASIFLRKSQDIQFTIDTIVHEVAHHYQYTHCIDQSESEAYSFERFYRDKNT